MKSLRQLLALAGLLALSLHPVYASRLSQFVDVERYAILTDGSLKLETGHLLDNGQFRVSSSEIVSPIFYSSLDDFRPFAGRPVITEDSYDFYKSAGAIPNWSRSRASFSIDGLAFVIVATAGVDPNPVPVITGQPGIQRVLVGNSAFFLVEATMTEFLSYQWRFRGVPIPGETDSYLSINNVRPAQAGLYSVAVNAGGKSVVSKPALLQVVKPVVVTNPPRSQTVRTGKPVVFRVAVTGTGPFKYQWNFNYQLIPNATRSFFTIPKAQAKDAGKYSVTVDNDLSSDGSADAVLTVVP